MRPLTWVGRHASALLILGFLTVPFFPISTETLRPFLPPLVVLVTALGFARQRLDRQSLQDLLPKRHVASGLVWLFVTQVLAALFTVVIGRAFGATSEQLIFIVAFFVAPPLSSAPNICLILGYDYVIALRLSVLGTFCAPVLMPLALSMSGMGFDVSGFEIALRVIGMLLGGIVLGVLIQVTFGPAKITRHADVLNGLAALAMIAFLFPLMSGAVVAVADTPRLAIALLSLAVTLNLAGNLLVRWIARKHMTSAQAASLGYVFGNRNLSLVLASLPFDPVLTLFVALMQAPIYATPALFSFIQRTRKPCQHSSES